MSSEGREVTINRREVLGGLGAAAAVGIAGCAEDDDGPPAGETDEEDLGERVPELGMGYFAPWPIFEQATEVASQNIEEVLDLDTNPMPVDHTTHVRNLVADNRESGMLPAYFFSEEVDPYMPTRRTNASEAGTGGPNNMQWVNCEYSNLIEAQGLYSGEERQQILNEALKIMSEEVAVIPYHPWTELYGMRTDIIEPRREGSQGIDGNNPESYVHTRLIDDDEDVFKVAQATSIWLETSNFWVFSDQGGPWNNLVHSPLYYHDPEWEIQPAIAESTEHEEGGERVIVNIHEDADFDNGDPVTAADVKFSYEYLIDNPGLFPDAPPAPWLDNIEEIDEKTVAFNLNRVHTPLETREFPNWGILHRDTWVEAGALEDPEAVDPGEDMVGSGPFELDLFVSGERIGLSPRDEYHVDALDPSQHPDGGVDIEYVRVADTPTAFEWLRAGDVFLADILGDQADQIEDEDNYDIFLVDPISNAFFAPQCNWGPTQFLEFRKACAAAINRAEVAAVASGGWEEPETHCTILARTHPWRPPDEYLYQMPHPDSDDPTGDPEAARQFLLDEGWGWDGDGNLRYPPDYDPSPEWPPAETPDPDDYPCLEDDGEGGVDHVPPEDFDPEDYL